MENEVLYRLLREFQSKAGLTIDALADAARIPDFVLQELIVENSMITIGTFASLSLGLVQIMEDEAQDSDALREIYTQFVDEYVTNYPEQFESFPNPYFKKTIVRIGEHTQQEAVRQKISKLLGLDEPASADTSPFAQLTALWKQLNDCGQQEAVNRLHELTFIPKYQKS